MEIDQTGRLLWVRLLSLAAGMAMLVGCAGDSPVRVPQQTAEELTTTGWEKFESGDFAGAVVLFDAAEEADPTSPAAYVGEGWSRLAAATNSEEFIASIDCFEVALTKGALGADVRAGHAGVLLALGGDSLHAAADEAREARMVDSDFVFSHRPSFDMKDILLIEAFAEIGQGHPVAAISAADMILPSGILEEAPQTWVVDGIPRPSFLEAVLAHLQKLSIAEAG
jgi:hypothetical protein